MNNELDAQQEWNEMGRLWQTQAVQPIDVARLRRDVSGRSWRLAAMALIEVASLAIAVWMVARFVMPKAELQARDWLVMALLAIAAVFTAWAMHDRRGLWRHRGLPPEALVRLEMDRARGAIRYWRINTYVTGVIVVVLAGLAISQLVGPADPSRHAAWWTVLGINAVIVVTTLAFERWRTSRLKRRLQQLGEIARQMQG